MDIAAPAFCALLWLGDFPSPAIIALSLFTAFSGYTAIYALNDLIGHAADKEKMRYSLAYQGYSVESAQARHPVAQGILSYKMAVLWMLFWMIAAIIGAYLLNPIIIIILLAAAGCEIAYCRLLKVTHWRLVLSGIVKAAGPISAIWVVDSSPSPGPVFLLFMWIFFWEIGGQNIPADWNDKREDKKVNAKTIPLLFGDEISGKIVFFSLLFVVVISALFPIISPLRLGWEYLALSVFIGIMLLIKPAYKLCRADHITDQPARLFNRASYYPLALLLLMAALIWYHHLKNGPSAVGQILNWSLI